jgi:hypothetical protein
MPSASVALGNQRGAYDLSNEVHLLHGYHVANTRDVVEHPSYMFISDVFFFNPCDQDMEDTLDAAMKENLKFVGKSFVHGPSFASPQ